ncbi:MAG: hypothetical protein AAF211_27465 [Myxococcota bacterium]
MGMRFWGIDPGQAGAIVAVGMDGKTVEDVRWWRGAHVPPRGLSHGILPHHVVVIERPYVGKDPHAALELSEWIGMARTQLPLSVDLQRPFAVQWRAKVLRRSRMGRKQAKSLAIKACRLHSGLKEREASRHDVAEAWAMARYGWGVWKLAEELRAAGDEAEVLDEVHYSPTLRGVTA